MHCVTQCFALLFRPGADDPPHPEREHHSHDPLWSPVEMQESWKKIFFVPLQEVKSNITILLLEREHFFILVQIFELEMPATPVHQSHKIRCRLIFCLHSGLRAAVQTAPYRAAASCGDGACSESHACGNANANLWSTRKLQLF